MNLTIHLEDVRAARLALRAAKAARTCVGTMRVLEDDDGIRKQTERLVARLEERLRSAKARLRLAQEAAK